MRKWCYAGVVIAGLLQFGAAPAHADVVPAAGPLGGGLTPDGRIWSPQVLSESALSQLLGGVLRAGSRLSGMPPGGTVVDPATVDAPGPRRSFSDTGRPIAGIDEDFR